jgi:YD repeat-containing protein
MTLIPQAGRPGGSTGKADALKYDAWNRLVQYKDDDSGAVLQTNEYDGLGRRIVRVDVAAKDLAGRRIANEVAVSPHAGP